VVKHRGLLRLGLAWSGELFAPSALCPLVFRQSVCSGRLSACARTLRALAACQAAAILLAGPFPGSAAQSLKRFGATRRETVRCDKAIRKFRSAHSFPVAGKAKAGFLRSRCVFQDAVNFTNRTYDCTSAKRYRIGSRLRKIMGRRFTSDAPYLCTSLPWFRQATCYTVHPAVGLHTEKVRQKLANKLLIEPSFGGKRL
jgi:hypothetical protein